MRELKFRAWDTGAKCYVELNNLRGERSIYFSPYDLGAIPPEVRNRVVLEQYTGLKDKNGKEIYEGDIVEYIWDFCGEKRKNNYVVEWLSGKVEYYPCSVDAGFTLPDSVEEYYVVIGNIHKNPELVEEK